MEVSIINILNWQGHTLLEEEADAVIDQNTLLHGEALLVVSSGKAEDIALELITQEVSLDLCSHSLFKQVATASMSGE